MGGLRKDPILREEYTMRSIRMEPSSSILGNMYSSSSSNLVTSRLALGEAAARLVTARDTRDLSVFRTNVDVSLTSLKGLDALTSDEWKDEFDRLSQELIEERQSEGQTSFQADIQRVVIYKTSFGSVPSKDRLAEWIETKWAPTILRSYDIGGIRVGARPVYASRRPDQKDVVEIVWQDLRDFQTVLVGRMEIQIMDTGIVAYRTGPTSREPAPRTPLSGEDILVRRLTDASTQAIEKGLATKPVLKKKVVSEKIPISVPSTTMTASGTVDDNIAVPSSRPTTTSLPESGPRTVGTRRSSERARGSSKGKDDESTKTDGEKGSSWQ